MFKYVFGIFHIVIITSIFLGCGYKTDPIWVDESNQTKEVINDK